ncbi:CBS domain-containing protein [Actinokineospora globicatena]|uniref:CBS domain-containing protein n=1 Tax=Actinokineospora globicatena TaxID=103729 RepID=A0A9W6QL14_9PSEU|nr:CBS domain-containing protein [Actinokineospora globicatena]GLW90178.1 hypothetical protein Aglo03_09940 [Actinokineospora globicatena]
MSAGVIPRQHNGRVHAQVRPPATQLLVRDVMDQRVATVRPDTPLAEVHAAVLATTHRLVPVITDDRLVGVVSATDLLRERIRSAPVAETAADVMNPADPISTHTTCADAARHLVTTTDAALPVVHDSGALAGMITIDALINALSRTHHPA